MFFLLRMAFWLGLVLVLLPSGKTPDDAKLPKLDAGEAVSAAAAAVSDMGQFCVRQPTACQVGGQAAAVIGHRAQAGARKIYQMITDKRNSDQTGSIRSDDELRPTMDGQSENTLSMADQEIEWRLPQRSATIPEDGKERK